MKITDKVYFYQGLQRGVRCWSNSIVILGKKKVLIDPGSNIKKHLDDLIEAMREDEIDISEIDEIWLTHSHPDHAASAGILSKRFRLKVRCHFRAEEVLESREVVKKFLMYINKEAVQGKKIIRTPFFWRRIGLKMLLFAPKLFLTFGSFVMQKIFGKWLPVWRLEVFDEEQLLRIDPDVQVLFLPGHTPEEIGFWLEKEKVMIIGDILNIGHNRERIPVLNSPGSNFGAALCSLKRIVDLPAETLIPCHGFFLQDKKIIKNLLGGVISRMERHRERVKEEVEKNPDFQYNIDRLSEIVLNNLPRIVSNVEKKQYLVAILANLGYL